MSQNYDFVVLGAGVIGINLALQARKRYPGAKILVLEKESYCGFHASTRNSGVLHAGFYYSADSLKAKFTREGNLQLQNYCEEKGLKINRCGKLVVAQNSEEISGLHELLQRAKNNGVPLELISEAEAKKIEPRVRTCQFALFSPSTASVDPKQVMEHLVADARSKNIEIQTCNAYLQKTNQGIQTQRGNYSYGYLINAAGLYADVVARDFGFSQNYRILPFKGVYLYGRHSIEQLRTHIYPVPNLANPFLGVHFTLTVHGQVKIGPTAIPAFWRENYKGWENFKLKESLEIISREARLFIQNRFGFRKLALEEIKKYYRPQLIQLASSLVDSLKAENYREWGKAGIRAQLFNTREQRLEMDFKFEGDDRSFHVLNAVSPAFTCSLPFTEFLFDQIEGLISPDKLRGKQIGTH